MPAKNTSVDVISIMVLLALCNFELKGEKYRSQSHLPQTIHVPMTFLAKMGHIHVHDHVEAGPNPG